ncbi:MAG: DUF1501 domain-containing protein [Fimbriiglobus sp.]
MFGITDRRHFMKHAAGAAAVTLPALNFMSGLSANAAEMKKNKKSLIILWMGGGPSTIDLWDMKPGSANGGDHKPKSTSASGVQITEKMTKVAEQFKHLSIVRSLTTSEGDHNRGSYLMGTGRVLNPLSDFPHIGSALAYQYSQDAEAMKNMDLPLFMTVGNGGLPGGAGAGFLGMKYANFAVQNPGLAPENVSPPQDVANRMERRKVMFDALENGLKTNVPTDAAQAHKDVYGKALQLVTSSRKEVFEFKSAQDQADLRRYAPTNDGFGRGCLLARKLVEAGVACVEVQLGGWDMHNGIFGALDRRLPALDAGMGSLVEDLAKTGKLKDTVIVWMGEFGRTPKINAQAGRDHWPRCWSVVVGGGNIKGGIAYGSTNADGTEVKDNPVKIGNLYQTIYAGLGINEGHGDIRDNLGRPRTFAANPVSGGGEEKASAIKDLVG